MPGTGVFEDIVAFGAGEAERVHGPTLKLTDAEVGLVLRVRALYKDATGTLEEVFSAPTAAIANVNDAAVINGQIISDLTPTETETLTASPTIFDGDGTTTSTFAYQWQQANATGVGGGAAGFADIATGATFTPGQGQVNRELRVVITYTDDHGTLETVTSAPTIVTGDFIAANAAGQPLTGNEGQDLIFGGGGGDIINGLGEDDRLDGGTGGDIILGGAGNDTITGGTQGDALSGEAGNDTFLYTFGDGADAVDGGADTDTLRILGTAAANTLDVVYSGAALTAFEGGSIANVESVTADLLGGTDTLTYAGTTANVTVNLADGTASGFTSIAGIENVTGGSGNDPLTGDGNANTLSGGGGSDTLIGGLGNDTLNGNGGVDTASYAGETDAMFINLAAGNARRGSAANPIEDTLISIENVIGGSGNDTITSNGNVNVIDGGGGNDTISAGGNNDTIQGGAGNDTIVGGTGNDTIFGDAGNDTINYTFGDGVDTIDGGTESDTLNITGTGGSNTLTVTYNGSVITTFDDGAGPPLNTVVNVEAINANLQGGTDTLSYAGTTVGVTVNVTDGTASGLTFSGIENFTGGGGNDTFTGIVGGVVNGGGGIDTIALTTITSLAPANNGAITNVEIISAVGALTGVTIALTNQNEGFDIRGSASGDVILAGGGADRITGGAGNDQMNGGSGNDTFVFAAGFGNDTIVGFDANPNGGQDLLDVSSYAGGADITATNFATSVTIVGGNFDAVAGVDTRITIGADTILLSNVNVTTINQTDFIL